MIGRRIRALLRGPAPQPARAYLEHHREAYQRAQLLVVMFYGLLLIFVNRGLVMSMSWSGRSDWKPLWAVTWFDSVGLPTGTTITMVVLIVGVLGSILRPSSRTMRITAFAGMLLYGSLANSWGKINHGLHPWIYACFIFIFLPSGEGDSTSRATRQRYLFVFSAAQGAMLLAYTLSGIWKIYGGVMQFLVGQIGNFHIDGFSIQIADRLLQTDDTSILGPFLIDHPIMAWLVVNIGIYLETVCVMILLRPRLHRLWGLIMICLHFGTVVILRISFESFVLYLALFFLMSPFQFGHSSPRELIANIPGLGWTAPRPGRSGK